MRVAPAFPPRRDRYGAWYTGPGAQRPHQTDAHSDFADTGAQIAAEGELIGNLHLSNTAAAVVWFQMFNLSRREIVLGTTRPTFSIALAANSSQQLTYEPPLSCPRGLWIFATTDQHNATGAAAGHVAAASIIAERLSPTDPEPVGPPELAQPRTSSPCSSGFRPGDRPIEANA